MWVFAGYCLHRLGLENDLDLIGINSSEALWIKSVVFIPLVALSTFYARAIQKFGGHRGWLSHGPFISTFIRLMFFGYPFILVFDYIFTDTMYREFFGMFVGLVYADILHTIADWATGELNFWGRSGAHSRILSWYIKKKYDFPSDETLRKRKNKKGWNQQTYDQNL